MVQVWLSVVQTRVTQAWKVILDEFFNRSIVVCHRRPLVRITRLCRGVEKSHFGIPNLSADVCQRSSYKFCPLFFREWRIDRQVHKITANKKENFFACYQKRELKKSFFSLTEYLKEDKDLFLRGHVLRKLLAKIKKMYKTKWPSSIFDFIQKFLWLFSRTASASHKPSRLALR